MRGLDAVAVVATEKNSMYVRLAKIWRIWRARNSRHGGGGGDAASLLPENVQFDPNLMSWVKLLLLLLLLLFLSSIRLDYLFKVIYLKHYKNSIEFAQIFLLFWVISSYFFSKNKYKKIEFQYIVGSAK